MESIPDMGVREITGLRGYVVSEIDEKQGWEI